MREGLSSRPGCEVCALQAAPAEESRCSEGRVGWGSLVPGRKMESRGEAAPGLGTGYWSLFTGPRGRSASLLPARFLSACQFGGWGGETAGGLAPARRAAVPAAAAALRPCQGQPGPCSPVYLGRNRLGHDGFLCLSSRPIPSRPVGPPGRAGRAARAAAAGSAAHNGEARARVPFRGFVAGASCRWVNGAEEIGEGRQKWSLKEGVSTGQRDKGQNTHGRRGTDGDGRAKTIMQRGRGRGAAPSFSR